MLGQAMFDIPGALHPNKDTEYSHVVNTLEEKTSLFPIGYPSGELCFPAGA
jgi:hypothetical protein